MGSKVLKNVTLAIVNCPKIIEYLQERREILKLYHDNTIFGSHVGFKRLLSKIKLKYHWKGSRKGLSTDVLKFVKNCHQSSLSIMN